MNFSIYRSGRIVSGRPASARVVLGLIAFLFFSQVSLAKNIYRYKDNNGAVVLNRFIPPEMVPRGYEILNEQGRILKVVPPALTPQQIKVRDAQRAAEAKRKADQEARRKNDQELIKLFGEPNDAVRILRRKVQDIAGVIQLKKGAIASIRNQLMNAEKRAANLERAGRKVADSSLKQIQAFKNDISKYKREIVQLQKDRKEVIAEFDKKIKRLEILTGRQADSYADLKNFSSASQKEE
jgi:hypothetical protein